MRCLAPRGALGRSLFGTRTDLGRDAGAELGRMEERKGRMEKRKGKEIKERKERKEKKERKERQ